MVESEEDVEKAVTDFFLPLFQGRHGRDGVDTGVPFQPTDAFLEKFLSGLPKLTAEQRVELERPLEMWELEDAMKKLPTYRSPGTDGLPYEFYLAAFPMIKLELFGVFSSILSRFWLTDSMREGVTRLLPKVKGIPAAQELRPITLLQVDYKLLTKVFVRRLLPVLPTILSSGQICSVRGSSIFYGAHNILSVCQGEAGGGGHPVLGPVESL